MARVFFALIVVTAALTQATILPALRLIGILPDATLVLLMVWSAMRGVPEGLLWAFGLGFFVDLLALDRLGSNALALLGVALLGGLARRRFFHSNLIVPLVLAVAATVVHAIVLLLLRSGDGGGVPVGSVVRLVALQALLNSIFVPPLYLIAGWMDRRVVTGHA